MSFPPEMTRPARGGPTVDAEASRYPTSAGLLRPLFAIGGPLPAVFGGLVVNSGGHCSGSRFCGFRGFLLDDVARARRVDVDPRAHGRRQRDLSDVPPL